MANLDLADFLILKEIYKTRSVTASVSQVGLSQPAISIRLGNLRNYFSDPLFVKTPEGMMPTPLMQTLIAPIDQLLDLLGPNRGQLVRFTPETSLRKFHLGLSHVAQMVLLPPLLTLFGSSAPRIQIDSTDLNDQTALAMAQGEIDIAIGYAAELNTGFYQQRLFTEHYSCIARKRHPRLADNPAPSTAQLLKEEYLSLVAPGTGHSLLDKHLHAEGITRSIKLRVSSFLGLEQIIVATDLLAIVPARLANTLAQGGRIRAFDISFPMPAYEVRQYWHERYHHDPGNQWLRQTIFNTFVDLPPVEPTLDEANLQAHPE